jgi:hypothetical protein
MPAPTVAPVDSGGSARVTSLSGTTVFVDAGSRDGLELGQTLRLIRDGAEIGTLKVDHLASHRAACSRSSGLDGRSGDVVRFKPIRRKSRPGGGETAALQVRSRSEKWSRRLGLRGRTAVRLLTVKDRLGALRSTSDPSFDLRLEGTRVAGSDVDLSVDIRARRTWRATGAEGASRTTRVHRLSIARQAAGSHVRISMGRLLSPSLASVNVFDGLLSEYPGERYGAGLFLGSQPGIREWEHSREVQEFGGYGRIQGDLAGRHRWSVTGGGIRSIAHGVANRDYVFLRGQWSDPRVFGYASQEVDLNRGWRRDLESSALSWTSTLLSVQVRPSGRLTLNGGFDNRRNVRLYNDRETPESEFDAAYRMGWSGGFSLHPARGATVGASYHVNGKGADRSDASTATWRVTPVRSLVLDLSGRHTRYQAPLSDGWLHAWAVGSGIGPGRHVEVHSGLRNERRGAGRGAHASTRWFGASVDVGIRRSFYLLLSGEATRGDLEKNDQYYMSLSYQL